jgi:hypothetical protein
MRSLADEWGCDASNATWIVERLVKRGFAERLEKPEDRRVKLIRLTELGADTKNRLLEGMEEPPPELSILATSDLQALLTILEKLPLAAPQNNAELVRDLAGQTDVAESSRGKPA